MSVDNRILPHPLLTDDRLARFFWLMMDILNRQNGYPFEISVVAEMPDIQGVLQDYFAQHPDDFNTRGLMRLIENAVTQWQMMRLVMPVDEVKYDLTADGIEWLETYQKHDFHAIDLFRARMSQTLWFAQTGLSGAELETYLRTHATPIRRVNLDDQIRTTFTILSYFGLTGDETKPSAPESATSPFSLTETDENPTIATAPMTEEDVYRPTETDENPTIATAPMTEEDVYRPTETDENPTIATTPMTEEDVYRPTETDENPTIATMPMTEEDVYRPTETDENPTIATTPMTEENYQSTETLVDNNYQPSWLDEDKPITNLRGNMRRRGGAGNGADNRMVGRSSFGRSIDNDGDAVSDSAGDVSQKSSAPVEDERIGFQPKKSETPPSEDERIGFQPKKSATPPSEDERIGFQPKKSATPPSEDERVGFQPPKTDAPPSETPRRRLGSLTNTTETHKPSTQPRRYGGSNEDTLGPRARGNRQTQTNPTNTNEGQPPTTPTTRKPPTTPTTPTSDKPKPASDKALGFLQGDNPRDRLSRVPKGNSSTEANTTSNRRERADYHPKGPRDRSKPPSVSQPILHGGEYYYEEQLPDGRVIRLSKKLVEDLMTERGIPRDEAIRLLRDLQGHD